MASPVCVVTGVGPGNGAAFSRKMSAEGYHVAMFARSAERLQALQKEIGGSRGYSVDVSDSHAVQEAREIPSPGRHRDLRLSSRATKEIGMDVRARSATLHGAMVMPLFVSVLILFSFFATVTAQRACACVGDCDENGAVTIDELILCADIALRSRSVEFCPVADANEDGTIDIDEVVQAVAHTLNGCPPASLPTSGPEMLAWLQAGNYLDWTRESGLHPSIGPHAQQVLTYFNEPLLASLAAGNASHPAGSASVKELFNGSGAMVGWAAMVKDQNDSDGGMGWYWYESFGTSIFFSAFGHPTCTGCHGSDQGNLTSKDFVLSPYPLQ